MKRSKALSLILMGSIAVGSSGCGREKAEEGTYTFTSLDECVNSAIFSETECRELALDALAQTPRFTSREDCEREFGAESCDKMSGNAGGPVTAADGSQVQQHSGGYWMPMMMGFMAGRFMGGGRMMQGSQGLYRDPAANPQQGRSFRTAGGETVKPGTGGRVTPTPRMTQSMAHKAKPAMGRVGGGTRGGFSGGKTFGGAAS